MVLEWQFNHKLFFGLLNLYVATKHQHITTAQIFQARSRADLLLRHRATLVRHDQIIALRIDVE